VSSPDLPVPVLSPGTTTTLVGETAIELAVAAAALAVGYRVGVEILPGWEVSGPGEVTFLAYEGSWLDWRSLIAFVADGAGITLPWIELDIRVAPFALPPLRTRDPVAQAFWTIADHKDVIAAEEAAEASGRVFVPALKVMFCGASGAGDGWMAEQCRRLAGETALLVTAPTAFAEPNEFEVWAGSFGSVVRLADLRDQVSGVSAFLARIAARVVDEAPAQPPAAEAITDEKVDVAAFFAMHGGQGVDAMRCLVTDSQSVESKQLKEQAARFDITPGQLWHHAEAFRQTLEEVKDDGSPVLYGYAAVTNEWRLVDYDLEGTFLERLAPGCFARTLAEDRGLAKCILGHGKDSRLGHAALGRITLLEEDGTGLRFECELRDHDGVKALVPWLRTGLYGCSMGFDVRDDELVLHPGPSAHNPGGIPERTVRQVRVQEFGPTPIPAYKGTSAGIRT
jgi:HK97 family phage prohead protease